MLKTVSNVVLRLSVLQDYLKGGRVKRSLVCTSSVATRPAASLANRFEHPTGSILRDEALGAQAILKHRPSRLTPFALRLLGEFFYEVAEFGEDQLFHRQPDGVLGTWGGEENTTFNDACGGAAHDRG